jgi:hypothetical protein
VAGCCEYNLIVAYVVHDDDDDGDNDVNKMPIINRN